MTEAWKSARHIGIALAATVTGAAASEWRRKKFIVGPLRERRRLHLQAHPPSAGDIVFLGDSLIHGGEWNVQLPELPVRNFGIAGDTSADALGRLGAIADSGCRAVALMIGTNDLTSGMSRADTVSNLKSIVRELRRRSSDTSVIVHTLLPRQLIYSGRIRRINDDIRESFAGEIDTLVDVYASFSDEHGKLRSDMTNDGLHLLPAGYDMWRDLLRPYLVR